MHAQSFRSRFIAHFISRFFSLLLMLLSFFALFAFSDPTRF